jgi:hypothetical protein
MAVILNVTRSGIVYSVFWVLLVVKLLLVRTFILTDGAEM